MEPLNIEKWKLLKKDEELLTEIKILLKVNNSQITERFKKLITENKELAQKLNDQK